MILNILKGILVLSTTPLCASSHGEQNEYLEVGDGLLNDEIRARIIFMVLSRKAVQNDWPRREAVWRGKEPQMVGMPTPWRIDGSTLSI